jgi:hypothetical protein
MGCCYSFQNDLLDGLDLIPGFKIHVDKLRIKHNLQRKYFVCSWSEKNIKISKMSDDFMHDYNQLQKDIIVYLKNRFPIETRHIQYFEVYDKEKQELTYDIDTWFKYYSEYNKFVVPFIKYKYCINRSMHQNHILYSTYMKLLMINKPRLFY